MLQPKQCINISQNSAPTHLPALFARPFVLVPGARARYIGAAMSLPGRPAATALSGFNYIIARMSRISESERASEREDSSCAAT